MKRCVCQRCRSERDVTRSLVIRLDPEAWREVTASAGAVFWTGILCKLPLATVGWFALIAALPFCCSLFIRSACERCRTDCADRSLSL